MAVAVAEAVSCVLQCVGVVCLCVARVVEWTKHAFTVVTKVVTCGQGWQGLFLNFLTFFNSEEDPDFKDFELPEAEDRKITDVPSLVLFITVLIGMMATMNRAVAYGKPEVYYQGMDSWGNVCGFKNVPIKDAIFSGGDMTRFDKLLIFDFLSRTSVLTSGDTVAISEIPSTTSLCVEHCPLITRTFDCWEFFDIKSPYPPVIKDILCQSAKPELASVKMRTLSFSERNSRCVPDIVSQSISVQKQNDMLNLYSTSWVHNLISDCHTCAPELTWISLIAVTFTLIFIAVIQSAADSICWFSFSSFCFVGIISSCSSWYLYSAISAEDTVDVLYSADNPQMQGREMNPAIAVPQAGYSIVFRDVSIYVTFVTIFFTVICCMVGKRNMDAAAKLFTVAIEAMSNVRWIYILPVLTFCSISFSAGLFLYTINLLTAVFHDEVNIFEDPVYRYPKVVFEEDLGYTNWVLFFEFLAFAWLFNFIMSCQSLIACSAISSWYFIKDKDDIDRPMRIASSRLLRNHLGSAAAGGLLVGFLGWMRAPFSFLQSRLNRALLTADDDDEDGKSSKNSNASGGSYSGYDYEKGGSTKSQKPASKKMSVVIKEPNAITDTTPVISKGPQDEIKPDAKGGMSEKSYGDHSGTNNSKNSYSEYSGSEKSSTSSKTEKQHKSLEIPVKYLRCVSDTCSPFFWVLNELLVYISDINFGIIALKGLSFIQAGYAVRNMLIKDPKLKGLGAISSFSIFLGKLSVVIISLPFGILFLKDKEGVFIYGYPMAMSAAVAFVVAHIFLSLFNATVGAVFACLMEDRALNDGSEEAPYFGSESLIMTFHDLLHDDDGETPDFRYAFEFPRPPHKKKPKKSEQNSEPESRSVLYSEDETVKKQPRKKKKAQKKKKRAQDGFAADHSSHFLLMPKAEKAGKTKEKRLKTKERLLQREDSQSYSDVSSRSGHHRKHNRKHGRHERGYSSASRSESGGIFGNLLDGAINARSNRRQRDDDDSDDDDFGGDNDFGGDDDDFGGDDDGGDMDDGGKKDKKKKDKGKNKKDKKEKEKKKKEEKDKKKKEKDSAKDKKKKDKEAKKKEKDSKKKEKDSKKKGKKDKDKTKGKDKKKDKDGTKKKDKTDKKKASKKDKSAAKKKDKTKKTKDKPSKAKKDKTKTKSKPKKTKTAKGKSPKTKTPKAKKPKKMKAPKGKKPKGKMGKMKKPKLGKKGKMKGMKKPKMGKMKGMKKPKMGKMKGFKKPKMKGLKKPKMGKMKGMKKPKMGKMKGPKMRGKMGGGMKGPKMGGGVGKMKGPKMGKMAKMGKGLGMAGAVIGGAEGAANIGNAMLRITGKKDQFNEKVEQAAFGTRKRAKAATAIQTMMGGGKGMKQAMRDVDAQFDDMEAEQKLARKRQKREAKREKNHMQDLLRQRMLARKR